MEIKKLVLGSVMTNCYIVIDDYGSAVVIDPADNAERIKREIDTNHAVLEKIILTHGHYDHFGALCDLRDMYENIKVYAHENSKEVLGDENVNLSVAIGGKKAVEQADVCLKDGDKIPFSDLEFEVLHTPGHTSDSMCLRLNNIIFSGDTVFKQSIGRSDFPTGDMDTEIKSIKSKLLPLDDDIILYPGHGESTTIGYERQRNPYLIF